MVSPCCAPSPPRLLARLLSSPRTDLPHQATTSHLKRVDSQVTPSQGARWRRLRSHQIRSLRRICCSGRRSAVMVVDLQIRPVLLVPQICLLCTALILTCFA
ncbi:uncharacterized protein, partial [Triticum aestivum]|uniref:uncharacterized protein n=1 Tax=Triticum aestivum TaxID=4565 RepID=UPI001D014AAD